jgi:hypothetical protein
VRRIWYPHGSRILLVGRILHVKFADPATTRPACPSSGAALAGAGEALASTAHEIIEAQLFRQMAVDSSSPNP